MMDPMSSIRDTFFQECAEQLAEIEGALDAVDQGTADPETVNALFRAVHSIKGGAGAFQFHQLVRFAHAFETTLDGLRSAAIQPTDALIRVMFRSKDALSDLVDAERTGGEVEPSRIDELIEALKSATGAPHEEPPAPLGAEADELDFQPLTLAFDDLGDEPQPAPAGRHYAIAFKPLPRLYRNGHEPARLLRELGRLGEMTAVCDASGLPPLEALDPEGAYLAWRIELWTEQDVAEIEAVFDFVVDDCELSIEPQSDPVVQAEPASFAEPQPAGAIDLEPEIAPVARIDPAITAAADTEPKAAVRASKPDAAPAAGAIRVDPERVDKLINLVGELLVNQAMLSQRIGKAGLGGASDIASVLGGLEQLTREIQDGVMAIRAQPVKPLFQRMARIVRELAEETGKSVRLRTEGDTAEVDRTLVERLADPLTHMIRNAIDHGIESKEKRLAAGKPEQGELRLSAAHRSGRILIEVADDGGGIDRDKVKSIALNKGLIAPDAQLSDSELDNLLFFPGFSTASTISEISGRGVGMDVVKRSVQALGGRVSIASRRGQGSTFSMSLPLTLAVLDGMVVSVADQMFVIPLTAIAETLRPRSAEVRWLGVGARILADRGGFAPVVDIGEALGLRASPTDPCDGVVLMVETDVTARCALVVDAIHDQRQVVIKSLEANYRRVPGIAAATILGDGRVALILDVDTIVEQSHRDAPASPSLVSAAS